MTSYHLDYDYEMEVRQGVAELIERDTVEGMEQYTRLFASMVGAQVFEDRPPSERLGVYITHPPLTLDAMPPSDMPGVFPAWTALAAEFPDYYIERCNDFRLLYERWQKGDLKPVLPELPPEQLMTPTKPPPAPPAQPMGPQPPPAPMMGGPALPPGSPPLGLGGPPPPGPPPPPAMMGPPGMLPPGAPMMEGMY